MNLVERARAIILNPGPTWATIEQEPGDLQQLFVPYLVLLALIPAIAGFIGWSVFGVGGFGMSFRIPIVTGLGMMISQYVMTLVMVFVWGWLTSMLAPTFGGQANLINGVKLAVYSSTPSMVAGVFMAVPGLSMLAMIGGLYALYLVYLGLPVLMKNPADKTLPYMAVAALVGIVGSVLISAASSMLMPSPMSRMGMHTPAGLNISTPKGDVQISGIPGAPGQAGNAAMTIKTPDGEVKIDVAAMEEMAKKMEAMAAAQEAKK